MCYSIGKISDGVSFDNLLDQIRDNVENLFDPITLVTRRDFLNIQRDYHLTAGRQHSSDYISVQLWIERMKELAEDNPIIYYEMTDDDIFLIIGNTFQKEMLRKFGSKKICVDTTHGVNEYDINLTSIVVVDDFGNGFPCIFCFSSKKDTTTWITLFEKVRTDANIGQIITEVFMSDDDPAFYNAWVSVMGPAEKRLLCAWHVDQSWRRNIQSKVHNDKNSLTDKKSLVYKTLKILHHEPDENKFKMLAQSFLFELNYDEDTREFGSYFKDNYMNRVCEWAYCYRKSTGINTNMYLEAIHKTIKYFYLNGRKNKRMDNCINALMKFIRDQLFSQFIKQVKNKYTAKSDVIMRSHSASKNIDSSKIEKISESMWEIPSSTRKNLTYEVTLLTSSCAVEGCHLYCKQCKICTHSFSCNCVDHIVRNNICKHIHAVAQLIQPQNEEIVAEETVMHDEMIDQFKNAIVNHNINEVDQSVRDVFLKLDLLKGFIMKHKHEYAAEQWNGIKRAADKAIDLAAMKKRKIKHSAEKEKENEPSNKRVEKQLRFVLKKRKCSKKPFQPSKSLNEQEAIRSAFQVNSLDQGPRDILNIHDGPDHIFF